MEGTTVRRRTPSVSETLTESDAKFLDSVGISPGVESDVRRYEFSPPQHRDFYPAFVYWRDQALRYERIATYSWGAWLIVTCLLCVVAICWFARP